VCSVRRQWVVLAFAALFVTGGATGGCSGGCSNPIKPLPKPFPASQVIEGGVQVRVTQSGMQTVTAYAKDLINNFVQSDGICIPAVIHADPGTALPYVDACHHNWCRGGAQGCNVNLAVNGLSTSVVNAQTLRGDIQLSGSTAVPIHAYYDGFPWIDFGECTLSGTVSNLHAYADINIGTNPATGEVTLALGNLDILDYDLSLDSNTVACDIAIAVFDFVQAIAKGWVTNQIEGFIRPKINDLIQGFLPKPLGIEGTLDVGALLSMVLPGAEGTVELHAVAGGYAQLAANGISVGGMVGVNADRDVASRGAADVSQPALCIPQWATPDLAGAPYGLDKVAGRGTFKLDPANAFLGSPDPASDVAIGLSRKFLDLAGRHLVASGTLCLAVGSKLSSQLNLGTVGLLVRSLSELGTGKEPVLLVVRPTAPITFDVGTGTTASPYLTAHVTDLEIDFYALIYERYIRAFTVAATVDLGVNMTFMKDANGKPVISPMLVGLDASKIKVKVTNAQLLRETPEQLEAVFPTLLNLFIPLLANAIPDISVPSIQGFTLSDLKLAKTTTSEDDFLAVTASLLRGAGKPEAADERALTDARIVRVTTPSPERIRAWVLGEEDGALPEVELALGGQAPAGQALEWQWSLDGGMWRPFTDDARFVVSDPALALQGRHSIQVRARAKDDWGTTDLTGLDLPFVIDSAPPRFLLDAARRDGDAVVLRAVDLVSDDAALEWAAGSPTGWVANGGRFDAAALQGLADPAGRVAVFVRDELGNTASAWLDLAAVDDAPPAAKEAGGCAVGGGGGGAGGGALVLLLLAALRGRRRLALLFLGAACSSAGGLAEVDCSKNQDCQSMCKTGELGFCDMKGACKCMPDIPVGALGRWSDVATAADGTAWVSAYNDDHGDLVVAKLAGAGRIPDAAWEFADGVPDGPVTNTVTTVRNGVTDAGDDVGLYTSIAVSAAGDPMVSHYDKTHASLRFSSRAGGKWKSHTVDAGALMSKDVGKYTSLTLDGTGRPGIAYLAIVKDGRTAHSEVRFAQAKVAQPAAASDWTVVVVESKTAPADPSMGMLDDVPYVNGLFIAAARTASGAPVVVYYDRPAGDLKLAEGDGSGGFKTPVVVDGNGADDVGWYPSLAITSDGKFHISYVDAAHVNLLTIDYPGGTPEVVDDGLRMDGTTNGGQPRPVYHFVGDNSGIIVSGSSRAIVYQDGTTEQLLLAKKGASGWTHSTIAGADMPYKGAYGFWAGCALAGQGDLVMSTFAFNQTTADRWIEIFRQKM
jgi:hypothetical protein